MFEGDKHLTQVNLTEVSDTLTDYDAYIAFKVCACVYTSEGGCVGVRLSVREGVCTCMLVTLYT